MAMSVTYTNFGGMLVHENRGGVETEYVPDTLGSVAMCRSATGTTTYTADYWPYGEVESSTGTNPSPRGFVGTLGYYSESVPGSVYVRAGTYLPNYAQWQTVCRRRFALYLGLGGRVRRNRNARLYLAEPDHARTSRTLH